MNDIRQIDLPEKDRPLRADVSLLGSLVGIGRASCRERVSLSV